MKRTLVVLALAVLSAAGCRAVGPHDCGDPCGGGYGYDAPCDGGYGYAAPCDDGYGCAAPCDDGYGCSDGYGDYGGGCGPDCGPYAHNGSLDQTACCHGDNCCMFNRYCGHDCGPGYGPGPYDCSPCDSPHWGNTGYRHPQGYVTGSECRQCAAPRTQPHLAGVCGNGYCCAACGRPAPSCCCCANSGDQNYNFNPGPPVAQTAYPYYTVRGPRDFLLDNPPNLGPY